jgi:hypothetical protein
LRTPKIRFSIHITENCSSGRKHGFAPLARSQAADEARRQPPKTAIELPRSEESLLRETKERGKYLTLARQPVDGEGSPVVDEETALGKQLHVPSSLSDCPRSGEKAQ